MKRIYDKNHRLIATVGEELDVKIPMDEYLRIIHSDEHSEEGEFDAIERANMPVTW